MNIAQELSQRIGAAVTDAELARLAPGLQARILFRVGDEQVGIEFSGGVPRLGCTGAVDIDVSASSEAWAFALQSPPSPTYHSFTAWQIVNNSFEVVGEPQLIAQARPALERIVELIARVPASSLKPVDRDVTQIAGRYGSISANDQSYPIYFEEAGEGIPVLFLHTAGADGRQFFAQMSDVGLANKYRMIAWDLPYHGRSLPPIDWGGEPYKLTADLYHAWCQAFIEQCLKDKPIVVGGSMGAAMALYIAARTPDLIRGVVALEPPFKSPGRRNPFQNHVGVHAGLHNGAFVRGLMSPTSPIAYRRRASWIYSQGGPGIYPGDLAFYSDEFDGAVVAPQISATRTPVALLSGSYDYSATPLDGQKLAALIPGALHIVMKELGHFPMTENPDHFRGFLCEALDHVTDCRGTKADA